MTHVCTGMSIIKSKSVILAPVYCFALSVLYSQGRKPCARIDSRRLWIGEFTCCGFFSVGSILNTLGVPPAYGKKYTDSPGNDFFS